MRGRYLGRAVWWKEIYTRYFFALRPNRIPSSLKMFPSTASAALEASICGRCSLHRHVHAIVRAFDFRRTFMRKQPPPLDYASTRMYWGCLDLHCRSTLEGIVLPTVHLNSPENSLRSMAPPLPSLYYLGVPPELPLVHLVACRTRACLRRPQPGDGSQGLPTVAYLHALQGIPSVNLAERRKDDQRTTKGVEGDMEAQWQFCYATCNGKKGTGDVPLLLLTTTLC